MAIKHLSYIVVGIGLIILIRGYIKTIPDDGNTSFNGRGFNVPLDAQYMMNKSGFMGVKVYDPTHRGQLRLDMLTKYYHKNLGINGSLSFDGKPSIGISLYTQYDTPAEDTTYFNYSTY